MPKPLTGSTSLDYAQAMAASMAAQEAPARREAQPPVAPRPDHDRATVAATQGSAPREVVLLDDPPAPLMIEPEAGSSAITTAGTPARAPTTAARTASTIGTAANVGRWGRTGRIAGTIAHGGARIAVKALPVVGAGLSLWDIGTDVRNWQNPTNKSKIDDVARIGGNAAVVAGTALLFTRAAPAGAIIAVGGLIPSGLGTLFGD